MPRCAAPSFLTRSWIELMPPWPGGLAMWFRAWLKSRASAPLASLIHDKT